jgi:hypothetical protein
MGRRCDSRAKLLGYLPPDAKDPGGNKSDAAALFDYAASKWGRVAPAFQLTGGK